MNVFLQRTMAAAILLGTLLVIEDAHAQFGDLIKQGDRAESSGGAGSLGDVGNVLSGQSLSGSSIGNVAGVLEYCVQNNYLGGKDATAVKDKLLGNLSSGSSSPSSDNDYQNGMKGLLKGGDGKQIDLSGGGLKAEATKQVCEKVLAQGKLML